MSDSVEIDVDIRPLVDQLRSIEGVTVLNSNHGYWHGRAPSVLFKSSIAVARLIEKKVWSMSMAEKPVLITDWVVRPIFDDDSGFRYLLYSPKYRDDANSLIKSIWLFGVQRKRLRNEFFNLANALKDIMEPRSI